MECKVIIGTHGLYMYFLDVLSNLLLFVFIGTDVEHPYFI